MSSDLDRYLANGWFRMGQTVFTTNFLNFNDRFYSAVWLRIRLRDVVADRSEHRLARLNSKFSVAIQKAEITSEKEDLFAKYRSSVSFEASHGLTQLLYGSFTRNVFDSYEVTVRDGGKLVACGIFDVGDKSAAGITSFYDPLYKKTSLGKFVIQQKVQYCLHQGLTYFYPGYFVPGYPRFDYKLSIQGQALEFYQLSSGHWLPIDRFTPNDAPIVQISEKLQAFARICACKKLQGKLYFYDYFDANLVHSLSHLELFDCPMFFAPNPDVALLFPVIVSFDIRDGKYHLQTVDSMWTSGAEQIVEDHYAVHLLKATSEIFASDDAGQVANAMSAYVTPVD